MSRLKIFLLLSVLTAALFAPMAQASAQNAQCEQTYVVQAGDWLSTIAQKFLGDAKAYDAIVTATNEAAKTDSSFTAITDPNKIEVGQKLCIPAAKATSDHDAAGVYTAVSPAADARALIETLILGGDGQAQYLMNYVAKAEIPAKGTWTQDGATVLVKLTEQGGKPTQETMAFKLQDGNLASTTLPGLVYVKTAPDVAFHSGLYLANRQSADGALTLNALTLFPNLQAEMGLTKNSDKSFILQTGAWELGTDKDTNAPILTVHLTKQNDAALDETYVFQIQGENLRGLAYDKDLWGTDLTFTKYHAPVEPVTPASIMHDQTAGRYTAQLPAADAVGRVIVLELNQDDTAVMTTQFIGKGEPMVEKGSWELDGEFVNVTLANGQPKLVFKQELLTPEDKPVIVAKLVLQDPVAAGYGSDGLTLERTPSGVTQTAEYGGVSFAFDAQLAKTAQGETTTALPVAEGPALGGGMPASIRFMFDGQKAETYFNPNLAQVLVYKTDDWAKLDPSTAASVDALKKMLQEKPTTFEKGIPVLPPIPAAQVFQVKPQYVDFQNGSGIAFVTYYAQDASPVQSNQIFYTFQGLTGDAKYYVAVFYPLNTTLLPKRAEDAFGNQSYDEWAKNYDTYLKNLVSAMNGLNDAAYTPDLVLIQDLIKSINVGDTTLQ